MRRLGIKETSAGFVPNTSALFLLGKSSDPDRVLEEMKPFQAFVATITLPEDTEEQSRVALKKEE